MKPTPHSYHSPSHSPSAYDDPATPGADKWWRDLGDLKPGPAPRDLPGSGGHKSLPDLLELAGIGAVAVSALIMTFLLFSLSPGELLGSHPLPLAIALAAVMTIGATLLNGADTVKTVLRARRGSVSLPELRARIRVNVSLVLLLWIALGPMFTPLPQLIRFVR